MKTSNADRIRALLNRADIPSHIQREVLNAFTTRRKDEPGAVAMNWRALLDRVRHTRRMVMTNKPRWSPVVAHLYQEYTDILSLLAKWIGQASTQLNAEGQPISIEEFTTRRAVVNKRRFAEGKLPLGACGTKWQDWAPLDKRREFMQRVESYYSLNCIPGPRFTPFVTRDIKAENVKSIQRIDSAIKNLRRSCANMGTAPPMADNTYGALYLAAARMAEIGLRRYRKETNILENPCPVNWIHLLDQVMRDRLRQVRAAEKEGKPYDIPVEWCRDFYMAPGDGTEGEDSAIVNDTPGVRELAQEIDTSELSEDVPPEGEETTE